MSHQNLYFSDMIQVTWPCFQFLSLILLYYTMDEFVCVLPSAVMEGGNKSHQRILAFVLAKVQVTVSTGKRGKYNMVAAYWKV